MAKPLELDYTRGLLAYIYNTILGYIPRYIVYTQVLGLYPGIVTIPLKYVTELITTSNEGSTMIVTDLITQIQSAPQQGVYAFVNESDKRALVCYSNFIPEAVCRTLKQLRLKQHKSSKMIEDVSKLTLVFLEDPGTQLEQKLAIKKWVDYYASNGYEMYWRYSFATVKLRYVVGRLDRKPAVRVFLVTNRYNRVYLGIFPSMPEAKAWTNKHYPDPDNITRIVRQQGAKNVE